MRCNIAGKKRAAFRHVIPNTASTRRAALAMCAIISPRPGSWKRCPAASRLATRYSTAAQGADRIRDVQPFFGEFSAGGAAIAHNGNITNAAALRRELIERGSIFQSSSDSECIIHLMARMQRAVPERMKDALRRVEGAFSVVAMTRTKLIGVRDLCVRPLVLGKIGDGYALASDMRLDIIGADFLREVEPGEMVVIEDGEISSHHLSSSAVTVCIFEHVYFSRPDPFSGSRCMRHAARSVSNWPGSAG